MLAQTSEPWVRWDWVSSHTDQILHALREHVVLTGIAVLVGMLIALPLALIARRWHWFEAPVLSVTGILYTIPSIALLALLVPWTGLTRTTAEIALVSYTLLILIRNTVAGLAGVPADVREAAEGMGYTATRQFARVEVPLALPVIMAGLRIATVSTVALATIGSIVSYGGLGNLLLSAVGNQFKAQIFAASVLCVLLAVALDLVLVVAQRVLTPWTRHAR